MDIEQLAQRLEWLDDERRKDKTLIATLQERIADLEESVSPLNQKIKTLEGDLARITSTLTRFEQIETAMGQLRVDLTRMVQDQEKQRQDRDRDVEKIRLADLESLNRTIGEVRKGLEPLPELKKSIQARTEGEFRLGRLIEELEQKIVVNKRSDEEYRRQLKLLDEGQRQDAKRLTDLQGEVGALRKRLEEQRGKVDVTSDSLRKIELRINDLQTAESERRQSQVAFIEKQNMAVVERDRTWKEWQSRFETIESQSQNLDSQLQSLDATHRAVKRAQDSFEEITTRFERRINEITEMQRLVEDRFRQEWVGFKADDQKRWTNYSLANEEHQREVSRQFTKVEDRLILLEDLAQELQDNLNQATEETQKRLQALLAVARSWVENYEQVFGRSR